MVVMIATLKCLQGRKCIAKLYIYAFLDYTPSSVWRSIVDAFVQILFVLLQHQYLGSIHHLSVYISYPPTFTGNVSFVLSVWSVCLLHPSFHFPCCVCAYIHLLYDLLCRICSQQELMFPMEWYQGGPNHPLPTSSPLSCVQLYVTFLLQQVGIWHLLYKDFWKGC